MKYFIITNPDITPNEISIINYILDLDSITLHLRKPTFSALKLSKILDKIKETNHDKIVIHNNHELIKDYNLKGIHFTHHNKSTIDNYLEYHGSKSISTHSFNEITSFPPIFDYYFLSPVFSSVSKPGYGGKEFDLKQLQKQLSDNLNRKVIALSGINNNNIQLVKQIGFYGAAILGFFWNYCSQSKLPESVDTFFNDLNTSLQK